MSSNQQSTKPSSQQDLRPDPLEVWADQQEGVLFTEPPQNVLDDHFEWLNEAIEHAKLSSAAL